MKGAAQGGEDKRSLHTAAGICIASPVAACLALPDGRVHVFNEPYRALIGTTPGPTSFAEAWPAIVAQFAAALAGTPALVETHVVNDTTRTVTLSLVPVRDEADAVCAVLVSIIGTPHAEGDGGAQLDSFRYTLSHDLLSPLRTLQEMARVIEHEHSQYLPPDASIFLDHFAQGTNKLADRVEALIRLVRLNAQPLHPRRVDVSRLVKEIVTELRATHGDRARVTIGELPDAHGDADLLRQLFANLLSNAFKFSRDVPEPRIEIGSQPGKGLNCYFVVDNGAGFDMKYAGKLFGLFQRMHGEAQFEGTGAGLAMARRIVERHGGTIRAEATKDQGARLSLTLPSAQTGAHPGA
jgi:signal transduction histidine kinase